MRTTGGRVVRGRPSKSADRTDLTRYGRRRSSCCTLVLHAGDVHSTAWNHGSYEAIGAQCRQLRGSSDGMLLGPRLVHKYPPATMGARRVRSIVHVPGAEPPR